MIHFNDKYRKSQNLYQKKNKVEISKESQIDAVDESKVEESNRSIVFFDKDEEMYFYYDKNGEIKALDVEEEIRALDLEVEIRNLKIEEEIRKLDIEAQQKSKLIMAEL